MSSPHVFRLLLPIPLALAGACNHMDVTQSTDRHPVVDHGVSATILMPGQQAPGMRTGGPYGGAPYGQPGLPPQAGYGAPGGHAPPPQANPNRFQSFGGSSMADTGSITHKSRPTYLKYLGAPVAVAAAPFKKLGKALEGKAPPPDPAQQAAAAGMQGAAPGASVPGAPMTREQAHAAQENARLGELERQLAMVAAPPAPAAAPTAPSTSAVPPSSGSLSIAEELAAMRDAQSRSRTDPTALPAPAPYIPRAVPEPQGLADQVEDRNGDGRPDFWSFKEGDQVVREVQDADHDGRPDKTVHYAPDGNVSREEEDVNRDGETDAWALYKDGELRARREDTDHDGAVDVWSFYRDGEVARTERDTDGDGFRDRQDLYRNGRLVREEEDRNADGRPDRVTWYDASGQVEKRDDDSDGDGAIDVRSHYEGGKLSRRELLTDEAMAELSRTELPTVESESVGSRTFQE